MEARISIITLGVSDLDRSFEFYHKGLGLPANRDPKAGIVFFKTNGVCLALYPADKLAEDVGESFKKSASGFSGVTLAHNVKNKSDVNLILQNAKKHGASIIKDAQDTFWGGYSGYFADPDGHLWEIAWGAFEFNKDGSLNIP